MATNIHRLKRRTAAKNPKFSTWWMMGSVSQHLPRKKVDVEALEGDRGHGEQGNMVNKGTQGTRGHGEQGDMENKGMWRRRGHEE